MTQAVPAQFQALFPSSPIGELSPARDKRYIIETLLKNASMDAWRWMVRQYSTADIAEALTQAKNLKKKDAVIWSKYLNIPESTILCLQLKSRSGLKSSWVY